MGDDATRDGEAQATHTMPDAAEPPDDAAFGVLEHERRARDAAERLAALKRRMGKDG